MIPGRTRFTAHLIRENGLGGGFAAREATCFAAREATCFAAWLFCPGMAFGAKARWWGDWGARDQPHVGLDLCLYQDRRGNVRRLDEATRVPAMYDGVVVHTCEDFLGRSIVMEHGLAEGGAFYSLYGHTVPLPGLQVGQAVRAGQVVARLSDATRSRTGVLPHLHVSLGRAPRTLAPERFAWETVAETLTLLDPLPLLDGPTRVVEPAAACRELVRALKGGAVFVPGPAEGGAR